MEVGELVQVKKKVAGLECQPCRWREVDGFKNIYQADERDLVMD